MIRGGASNLSFPQKTLFLTSFILSCLLPGLSFSMSETDEEYERRLFNIYNTHYKDPTPHSDWQKWLRAAGKKRHKLKYKDNMWDLSGSFFKNSLYWSKMWVANPDVENPHQINKGDFLNFAKFKSIHTLPHSVDIDKQFPDIKIPENEFARGALKEHEIPSSIPDINLFPSTKNQEIDLSNVEDWREDVHAIVPSYVNNFQPTSTGYIVKKDGYGDVISAPGEKMIVKVEAGVVGADTIFTVFKNNGNVAGLFSSNEILIKGRIKILSYITGSDKLYFAEAIDIVDKMELSDSIYQGEPPSYVFTQTGPMGNAEGQIVGTRHKSQKLLGTGSLVYLNKGSNDGVFKQRLFHVKSNGERGDLIKRTEEESLGKILVVHVTTKDATGIIVESRDQIYVGDTFTGNGLVEEDFNKSIEHELVDPMTDQGAGKELLLEVEEDPNAKSIEEEFDVGDINDFDPSYDEPEESDPEEDPYDDDDDNQELLLQELESVDSGGTRGGESIETEEIEPGDEETQILEQVEKSLKADAFDEEGTLESEDTALDNLDDYEEILDEKEKENIEIEVVDGDEKGGEGQTFIDNELEEQFETSDSQQLQELEDVDVL